MHRILIAEDEEGIRSSVERLLRLEGYEVASCADGRQAWVIARSMLPDVLVTDIHMPGMDGFALLEKVRTYPELANCVVIVLTAAEDRANMRRGMTLGADDYITKPFRREELLDSISAQLKKKQEFLAQREHAVAMAVSVAEDRLRREYVAELSTSGGRRAGPYSPVPTGEVALQEASVLFADIRNFTSAAEKLSVTEVAHILAEYFQSAYECVHRHGGHHLKILGDGLMAVFDDGTLDVHSPHARRALLASLDLAAAAVEFQSWLGTWYAGRGLPAFAIGVGVHTGEVMFGKLGSSTHPEVTPLGDVVNTAARLESLSKTLGWTVVASQATVALAGAGFEIGRDQTVDIKGRTASVRVCEVLGLSQPSDIDISLDVGDDAVAALEERSIRQAIAHNSQMTARAVKGAIRHSLAQLEQSGAGDGVTRRFKGYTILRKIGQGGMSEVYLARDDNRPEPVVVKLLRTDKGFEIDMLKRFIQEYAVLSGMDHPNIARIYDQGFTDDFAYIAMEYLEGGSLQVKVGANLPDQEVLDILQQLARALEALHAQSLVHRDLKPENLMYRASGELVLADFGVVKRLCGGADEMAKTMHGEIIGTPYYISPEQASNAEVGFQSDFYSLGVILYELLTGQRPYLADSIEVLIARHLYAAIPSLPLRHARFQPLIDRLMAKTPRERFQTVAELTAALRMVKLTLA